MSIKLNSQFIGNAILFLHKNKYSNTYSHIISQKHSTLLEINIDDNINEYLPVINDYINGNIYDYENSFYPNYINNITPYTEYLIQPIMLYDIEEICIEIQKFHITPQLMIKS